MQGQVARCNADVLSEVVGNNLQRLRNLAEADLVKEFTQLKLNHTTQAKPEKFVSTGMGDPQTKMLTVAEAKKRKADTVLKSRKQQRLPQAEQPREIEGVA